MWARILIAGIVGGAVVFFVGFMGSLTVYLGKWGVSQTPGATYFNRDPGFLFVWSPTSFGWRDLLLADTKLPDGRNIVQSTGIDPTVFEAVAATGHPLSSLPPRSYPEIFPSVVATNMPNPRPPPRLAAAMPPTGDPRRAMLWYTTDFPTSSSAMVESIIATAAQHGVLPPSGTPGPATITSCSITELVGGSVSTRRALIRPLP